MENLADYLEDTSTAGVNPDAVRLAELESTYGEHAEEQCVMNQKGGKRYSVLFMTKEAFVKSYGGMLTEVLKLDDYKEVAQFNADEINFERGPLEGIYFRCQNLEVPWHKTERSMMMGDVILDNETGIYYIVDTIGFKTITL
jgi:hypothetical protein